MARDEQCPDPAESAGEPESISNQSGEIGQTRAEVEERLGDPDFSEAYSYDGAEYHILHYRTQHRHSDGDTTREETTPLIFRDGRLEGWGDTLYARITADADA